MSYLDLIAEILINCHWREVNMAGRAKSCILLTQSCHVSWEVRDHVSITKKREVSIALVVTHIV